LWAAVAATVTTAVSAATTTVATITAAVVAALRLLFSVVFLFVDPAFDTDDAIDRAGFSEAVVEGDAEGLKRDFAFAVSFSAGDVGTAEAAGAAEADAFGTEVHRGLEGAFHGAAETDAALKLDGDLLGDELGIEFRFTDFDDIDFDLGAFAEVGDVVGHHFDLLTLAADDEARAGGVEGDADAVPSTLDDDFGESGGLQLPFEVVADREVLVKFFGVVFACGVPLGAPVFVDGEAECDRIYFLAQVIEG
jgi:hypothetical protein